MKNRKPTVNSQKSIYASESPLSCFQYWSKIITRMIHKKTVRVSYYLYAILQTFQTKFLHSDSMICSATNLRDDTVTNRQIFSKTTRVAIKSVIIENTAEICQKNQNRQQLPNSTSFSAVPLSLWTVCISSYFDWGRSNK